MTPCRQNISRTPLTVCKCTGWPCIDFPIMSGPFSSTTILSQSLPISFWRRGTLSIPIFPSATLWLHSTKGLTWEGWGIGRQVGDEVSWRAIDNSVFGDYRREDLAGLSLAEASRGGNGRTP